MWLKDSAVLCCLYDTVDGVVMYIVNANQAFAVIRLKLRPVNVFAKVIVTHSCHFQHDVNFECRGCYVYLL